MTFAYLLAYFFTPDCFQFTIPIINVRFVTLMLYLWPLSGILCSVPINIIHIRESYRNGTGYNRTFVEANRPLISPIILFISSTWWALASPHMIIEKQTRMFLSAIGTTFSNIACRLVVAQMTSTRSNGINKLLYLFVPLQIMAVYNVFNENTEFTILCLYNLIATLTHIHYGCCVVRQICEHLRINVFKITDRSKEPPPADVHIKH